MKKYIKDCAAILVIIINTLIYGSWKDRIQIIKDSFNCESWLYEETTGWTYQTQSKNTVLEK